MAKEIDMLFVTGAPRSGTTTLLDFLTVQREVGWIPEALSQRPESLGLASRVRRQHWPMLGDFWLERRYAWKRVTSPAEDHQFWAHWIPGFEPDLTNPEVPDPGALTDEQVERARSAVHTVCRKQGVSHFVGHYTRLSRVAFLRRIFPEARFIQVLRDPRSVAYHLVRKVEGGNHLLWEQRDAWIALLPPVLQERWKSLEPTPLNFSGIMVRWYHMQFVEEFAALDESEWMEVAYADLMAYPEPTLKRVYDFAKVSMSGRFRYYLKYHQVHSSNQRTSRNLDEKEKEQLKLAVSSIESPAADAPSE